MESGRRKVDTTFASMNFSECIKKRCLLQDLHTISEMKRFNLLSQIVHQRLNPPTTCINTTSTITLVSHPHFFSAWHRAPAA